MIFDCIAQAVQITMNNPSLKAGVRKTPEPGIPSIDEFRLFCTSNPDHHKQPQPKLQVLGWGVGNADLWASGIRSADS